MFTATKFLGDQFESVPYVISLVAAYGFHPPDPPPLKWSALWYGF
jgi:hypothetical protein